MFDLIQQSRRHHFVGLCLICLTIVLLAGCGQKAARNEATRFVPIAAPTLSMVKADSGNLEIWVDGVADFYAIDMEIQFDPAHLQAQDIDPQTDGVQIQPGQAPAPDFVAENKVDNQAGKINYVVTQVAPREGFDGHGLVATIAWEGTLDSAANLSFGPVTLVSQAGEPIEVATQGLAQFQPLNNSALAQAGGR